MNYSADCMGKLYDAKNREGNFSQKGLFVKMIGGQLNLNLQSHASVEKANITWKWQTRI